MQTANSPLPFLYSHWFTQRRFGDSLKTKRRGSNFLRLEVLRTPNFQNQWEFCGWVLFSYLTKGELNGKDFREITRHYLARYPRHKPSAFNLIVDIHVIVNWKLSEKGIRQPVSHDCIVGLSIQLTDMVFFV